MKDTQELYKDIQRSIENKVGRVMVTPKDFDYLSEQILEQTKLYLSSITLKRFWGYLGEKYMKEPRLTTLNVLAQMVGYSDWTNYYLDANGSGLIQSGFIDKGILSTSTLTPGTLIELRWNPNRRIVMRYEGNETFQIVASGNSKLNVGDTFNCKQFIEGEALFIENLTHNSNRYACYVCGHDSGIKFRLIDKN